ncbi:8493_t:CDS:2 [Diversispora eburnea]|uniref:8493_t:CDS:1 n=1 Tax=Diversispora eburnea TaxID=1213867 RepID=A0A9N8WHI1_9GLOM|nr:8493_t:CDS:2 [Diversispora eburnea]
MLYIPKIAHVRPIYLQYDKEPNLITAEIDFVEGGKYRSILTAEQSYDISIDLYVPASETNIGLGNFMIYLRLTDSGNQTVIESYRPEKPVTKAFLSISNKQLNTYNAQIRLDAHFRGLRYFMYYHQASTAVAFISLFLFWEIFASILAWRLLVSWIQNNMQPLIVPTKNIPQTENVGVLVRRNNVSVGMNEELTENGNEESNIGSSSTGRTTAAAISSNTRVHRRNIGGGNETNEQ